MKKKQLKTYRAGMHVEEFDDEEILAYNLREAKEIAKRMAREKCMELDYVEEIKDESNS